MSQRRRYQAIRTGRYRSRFESRVAAELGPQFAHESRRFPYTLQKTYLPDFVDEEFRIVVEAKGTLHDRAEREKLIAVKAQHPDWTFCIWFQAPDMRIGGTHMTHRQWATKWGFEVL